MESDPEQPKADTSGQSVRDFFEGQLTQVDLETQIANCDAFEILPVFMELLPGHQPILDAGCGSGRWVAWFARKGYSASGLDWSKNLCDAARAALPGIRFEYGDVRDMPFRDGEFGSIIALGTLEHTPEGPEAALREFHRVLRPRGMAIITVPYGGMLRRLLLAARAWLRRLRGSPPSRPASEHGGRPGKSLEDVRRGTVRKWCPFFMYGNDGWYFYQYHFTKPQMRRFLESSRFSIVKEWVAFHEAGVVTNFGRRAGIYDRAKDRVLLSSAGKLLRAVIPASLVGHMLCYVVRRS